MLHIRRDDPPRLHKANGELADPGCTHDWRYHPVGWDYSDLAPSVVSAYCRLCQASVRFVREAK